MENFIDWTVEQIEDLINRVYGGLATRDNLPPDLYAALLDKMEEAIIQGFGAVETGTEAATVFGNFGENIRQFSFAKTFQQINDMENFTLDANGNQLAFSEFKEKAEQIFQIYNQTWLETEFNTAKSITESARQWVNIQEQADVLPFLKYQTAGDERVRASHRPLDGVIKRVDDPFWLEYYPPLDFNCRCIVIQLEEGEITDTSDLDLSEISDLFKTNPAVTGEVFSEERHPYFRGLGDRVNDF